MYSLTTSGVLRFNGVEIPIDDRTAEYQAYVDWLRAGNGPELIDDYVAPRRVITINAWQLRRALNTTPHNGSTLRAAVEAAVAATDSQDIKDGYNFAPYFNSDEPLTIGLGAQLGLDESAVYALFELGETL